MKEIDWLRVEQKMFVFLFGVFALISQLSLDQKKKYPHNQKNKKKIKQLIICIYICICMYVLRQKKLYNLLIMSIKCY